VGGAHHQSKVVLPVPLEGQACYLLVQAQRRLAFAGLEPQALQIGRARVRGLAQQENPALGVFQQRLERIPAQVRTGGEGVRAQRLEGSPGIGLGGGGDIAALGIQDDRGAGWNGSNDLVQRLPARRSVCLEEGGVGLEGRGVLPCGLP